MVYFFGQIRIESQRQNHSPSWTERCCKQTFANLTVDILFVANPRLVVVDTSAVVLPVADFDEEVVFVVVIQVLEIVAVTLPVISALLVYLMRLRLGSVLLSVLNELSEVETKLHVMVVEGWTLLVEAACLEKNLLLQGHV